MFLFHGCWVAFGSSAYFQVFLLSSGLQVEEILVVYLKDLLFVAWTFMFSTVKIHSCYFVSKKKRDVIGGLLE